MPVHEGLGGIQIFMGYDPLISSSRVRPGAKEHWGKRTVCGINQRPVKRRIVGRFERIAGVIFIGPLCVGLSAGGRKKEHHSDDGDYEHPDQYADGYRLL